MRKLALFCTALGAMLLAISATPVHAQNVLWVASGGSDAAVCSQTAPCATFQGALDKGSVTLINCLNSGNYGGFTIDQSVTIDCGAGNVGNVVVSAGSAIIINTAAPAAVVLRHLSLNGLGTANYGINATFAGGSLIFEDCTVQGFGLIGIYFASNAPRGLLQVSNSEVFRNNDGIYVLSQSGQIASVALNRVEMVGNINTGLALIGNGIVAGTMRRSVVAANGNNGVAAEAKQLYFTVEGSSITANLVNGIVTNNAAAVVNVGGSTIGGNGTGVKATAGQLISFGNNEISLNGRNGSFTGTAPLQ